MRIGLVLSLVAIAAVACSPVEPGAAGRAAPTITSHATAAPSAAALSPRISRPAAERVVAIGDLHGDLDHARRALRLAGATDASDHWIGGKLVVVQTGDAVDRGDDDRAIVDLLESLKQQASAAGGELVALLGNHEIMNAELDFRYVTEGAFAAFADAADAGARRPLYRLPPSARGRAAAFRPGGAYAAIESHRPLVVKVGDTVFVHGGILPKHVAYGLDRMNDELDAWLRGERPAPPEVVVAEDGPVWTRAYSAEDHAPACATLKEALAAMGAKMMVVGHTVQRAGINPACEGAVYRVDVGLSRYYGGPIQALELRGGAARVLREEYIAEAGDQLAGARGDALAEEIAGVVVGRARRPRRLLGGEAVALLADLAGDLAEAARALPVHRLERRVAARARARVEALRLARDEADERPAEQRGSRPGSADADQAERRDRADEHAEERERPGAAAADAEPAGRGSRPCRT